MGRRVRGSNPSGIRFSAPYRNLPRPTQPPAQCCRVFPGSKATGAWCWPPTSYPSPRSRIGWSCTFHLHSVPEQTCRGAKYGARCASLSRFGRVFYVIPRRVAFLFATALWEKFASQIGWRSVNEHIWIEKYLKSSAIYAAAANLLCSHIDIVSKLRL